MGSHTPVLCCVPSLLSHAVAPTGLRALGSLPALSTDHILEHRPGWGELYNLLGVEPASLAQLLQALLLPYLHRLTQQDRLAALEFIKAHWAQSRQYSGPLRTVNSFAAALKEVAFVPPAALKPTDSAAVAGTGVRGGGASSLGGAGAGLLEDAQGPPLQQQQQLFRPAELFDPSVPLFAAVMATMAAGVSGAAAAGAALQVLFPAAPFSRDEWLSFLRDLGLQHRITKETFLQLAQHVAQQVSTRAQHSRTGGAAAGPPSAAGASSSTAAAAAAGAVGSVSGGGSYLDVTGADPQQLQTVEAAADALLAHLRAHWTGLGQDRPFWQALASVPFWPATLGVPGEQCLLHRTVSCPRHARQQTLAVLRI